MSIFYLRTQVVYKADSLRLDLLRLGQDGNPLVSIIGSPDWTCRDIGPGSPLAYRTELVSERERESGENAHGMKYFFIFILHFGKSIALSDHKYFISK